MENKAVKNPSRDELITDFVKSNPDYYIKKSPLSAPAFFWLRLKNILQDTYGEE